MRQEAALFRLQIPQTLRDIGVECFALQSFLFLFFFFAIFSFWRRERTLLYIIIRYNYWPWVFVVCYYLPVGSVEQQSREKRKLHQQQKEEEGRKKMTNSWTRSPESKCWMVKDIHYTIYGRLNIVVLHLYFYLLLVYWYTRSTATAHNFWCRLAWLVVCVPAWVPIVFACVCSISHWLFPVDINCRFIHYCPARSYYKLINVDCWISCSSCFLLKWNGSLRVATMEYMNQSQCEFKQQQRSKVPTCKHHFVLLAFLLLFICNNNK